MYALTRAVEGVAIAHVLWALFYVTGSLLLGRAPRPARTWVEALLIVAASTVAGMGIWAFAGFVLGNLRLVSAAGLAIGAATIAITALIFYRDRLLRSAFWTVRASLVVQAFRSPAVVLYAAALVLSVPAVFPDVSYDGLHFHLAYAYAWFRAGRIYADPTMRFPYYALNAETLYAYAFAAHIGRFIPYLSWLCGTQAIFCVTGIVATADASAQAARSRPARIAATLAYVAAPAGFVSSATFLRWWPTAMTDAMSCATFTATAALLVLASTEAEGPWLRMACVCGGFLAGMKPSYLFFMPMLGGYVVVAAYRAGGMRRALTLAALLATIALPWYVRNTVRIGDPIPPIFSLMLHRPNPVMTAAQWQAMTSDLQPHRRLAQWLLLPFDVFAHPQTDLYREYGVTLVVFAIYLVAALTPVLIVGERRPESRGVVMLFACTALGLVYLALSSMLARYMLLIYPALTACAVLAILEAASLVPAAFSAAPFAVVLLAWPSPGSSTFYAQFRDVNYRYLATFLPNDAAALARFASNDAALAPALDAAHLVRDRTALLIEVPLNYYVERAGYRAVGDYVGPVTYADVTAALDAGRARAYMDEHHIGIIAINRSDNLLVPDEVAYLQSQLLPHGWYRAPSSDRYTTVLVRRAQ
jgi:hypothetical protein